MHPRWRVLPLLALLAAGCEDRPSEPPPKEQAEGYYVKGTTEYLQGKFEDALASFNTMKALSPDDPRLPYNQVLRLASDGDALSVGMTHDFPDREVAGSATLEERMHRHFGGRMHVVVAGDTHVPLVKTWRSGCGTPTSAPSHSGCRAAASARWSSPATRAATGSSSGGCRWAAAWR